MTDNRNLILAIVISVLIMIGFQFAYDFLYPKRTPAPAQTQTQPATTAPGAVPSAVPPAPQGQAARPDGAPSALPVPGAAPTGAAPTGATAPGTQTRAEVLARQPRLPIQTPALHGSIALIGGRLDNLTLVRYREGLSPTSPEIVLLSPTGAPDAYFAQVGWVNTGTPIDLPDAETRWTADVAALTPSTPVTLSWTNAAGVTFKRIFAVDENYMFTVRQEVINPTGESFTLSPYSLVARFGNPPVSGFYILHEGPLGVFNGTLKELKYADLQKSTSIAETSKGGWIGFTDKYWLTALIPAQNETSNFRFFFETYQNQNRYQVDMVGAALALPAGGSITTESRIFAGAKVLSLLQQYQEAYGIPLFDRSIDFGWFYFLTMPIFKILRLVEGVGRQLRRRHPAADRLGQASVLPAGQQVLSGDEPDAQAAAGDDEAAGALRRRPRPVQSGDDGALQAREGQPGVGLPADRHPDPGVLRPLQGAVRHHRDAPCAVLRLDSGPLGARSDVGVQPVRADPLGSDGRRAGVVIRRLAVDHGRDDVPAAEAEPAAAGSDPGEGVHDPAGGLHLLARPFPGRTGDLLGLEQPAVDRPAVGDHEEDGGQDLSAASPADPPPNEEASDDAAALEAARRLFAADCRFIAGVAAIGQIPDGSLPEIAFAGRSNVGKSSLINALTGRRSLAIVSDTPGRTRQVNFFDLAGRLTLVDLPGYGYAKASKGQIANWTALIEHYLKARVPLRRVVLLIDARHGLKDSDRKVMALLDTAAVSYQVVLTKADKLESASAPAAIAAVAAELARHPAAHPRVLATSARSALGVAELRAELASLIAWSAEPPG